jgi:hypothetical protein
VRRVGPVVDPPPGVPAGGGVQTPCPERPIPYVMAKYVFRCNYPRLSKKKVSPQEDKSMVFRGGVPRNHTGVSVAFSVGSAEVHLLSSLDPKGQLVLGRG